MKILYGIQGTGNGHITRARVMARAFSQHPDVHVDYLFTGRNADKYFDMEEFGDYQTRQGLTFIHRNGAINKWLTLKNAKPMQFWRDVKQLDLSGYDLVLNDFEPVSAWAAKRQNIASISISHQAAFMHSVPKRGQKLLDEFIMKYFAPTSVQLGVHWYHFGHNIMPPFIDDEFSASQQGQHFLVYLPFEDIDEIRALLESLTEYTFEIYHPEITNSTQESHLHWHPTSKRAFHHSLHHCAGVIANGGFELSSECLQLGKKLLIKPLHGQFEQLSNALTLETLELCHTMNTLDVDEVENWLLIPQGEAVKFPNDPKILIDWIKSKQWNDTETVCEALWKQVEFPEKVRRKLAKLSKVPHHANIINRV
ncbi:MJ1255/VC2487 family glycosyltransferase [Alteromonas sp. a30]|uniref:MJ1255/VC2487 family glycosyltransferase n=1 Tax=Alteromonas sp. a30 TaxID=2730917 RepID=UPI002281797E|nr:MJ1255/VC2487 family glycosyltransferase [Alteromonas sp. a30]MCY7295706.1 glycosyltransferase [Alteromonas sp. a30]